MLLSVCVFQYLKKKMVKPHNGSVKTSNQSNQRYKHLYYMCRMRFKKEEANNNRQKKETRDEFSSNTKQYYQITTKASAKTFIYGTFWTSIMRLVHRVTPACVWQCEWAALQKCNNKTTKYQIYSIHNPYAHILLTGVAENDSNRKRFLFLLFSFASFFLSFSCYYLSPITLFTAIYPISISKTLTYAHMFDALMFRCI